MSLSDRYAGPRDIVVVGASAGGLDALRSLVRDVPSDYPGTLLLILHMARNGKSVLHEILANDARLRVLQAHDRQAIESGAIYVCVPDHHLTLDGSTLRVRRGPTEHRHRPSIDVLFRSAAQSFGPRVVGVVLTGMLYDGTTGLLEIKRSGGITIVQDPIEAAYSSMPESALRRVDIDYSLPIASIPPLLVQLALRQGARAGDAGNREHLNEGAPVPSREAAMNDDTKPSAYSCPDCHGVLWDVPDAELPFFRCRVGHGYSKDSLIHAQADAVEDALWQALRSLEEQASLLRQMIDQARDRQSEQLAGHFERKAKRSEGQASLIRKLLLSEEWSAADARVAGA